MIGISNISKNYPVRTQKAKRLRKPRENLHEAIELNLLSNRGLTGKEIWARILSVRRSRLLSNEAAKIEKVFALVPKQ